MGKKTAFITGGSQRIGADIACHLAESGYHIALHYNSSLKAAQLLQEKIIQIGGSCDLFQADLRESDKVQEIIQKVESTCPSLSLLINNASLFMKDTLQNCDPQIFLSHFHLHLFAPIVLTKEFANRVQKGQVINIIDTKIHKIKSPFFSYLLSKKALAEFTKAAAEELAPRIRVNGIAPGYILPPNESNETTSERSPKTPRYLPPLELPTDRLPFIRTGIDYLIKNSFVTGEILKIDGGEAIDY